MNNFSKPYMMLKELYTTTSSYSINYSVHHNNLFLDLWVDVYYDNITAMEMFFVNRFDVPYDKELFTIIESRVKGDVAYEIGKQNAARD